MTYLNGRIDLSGVPSSMEEMARKWGGKATPPTPAPRPAPKPRYSPPRTASRPPVQPKEEARAKKDALRSFLRSDTPHPATFASHLPLPAAEALTAATCTYGTWRYAHGLHPDLRKWLRMAGLAYVHECDDCLTIFAQRVRAALVGGGE